jgi:hypothetical protein
MWGTVLTLAELKTKTVQSQLKSGRWPYTISRSSFFTESKYTLITLITHPEKNQVCKVSLKDSMEKSILFIVNYVINDFFCSRTNFFKNS